MAWKKKSRKFTRRPFRRTRRTFKRKYSRRGVKTFLFKRKVTTTLLMTTVTANPYLEIWTNVLSSVPNISEFTNLFNKIKLSAVKYRYKFPFGAPITTINSALLPTYPGAAPALEIASVIDNSTNSVADASWDAFMERNPRVTQVNNLRTAHKLYYKPYVAVPIYDGAIDTAYGPKRMWLESSDVSPPHYGHRLGIRVRHSDGIPNTFEQDINIDIETTYYIACRGMK